MRWSKICLVSILLCYCSTAGAGLSDYFDKASPDGKLYRFDEKIRRVYYHIDALEDSPNWDYRARDFMKDQMVADAFRDWEFALNGKLSFLEIKDAQKANILIHWRNGFNQPNLLGLEQPRLIMNGKYIRQADIQITLMQYGKMLSKQQLKAIALHEIGHALGIRGHSPQQGDIMYASAQENVNRLSSRDIETMRMIYSRPAG